MYLLSLKPVVSEVTLANLKTSAVDDLAVIGVGRFNVLNRLVKVVIAISILKTDVLLTGVFVSIESLAGSNHLGVAIGVAVFAVSPCCSDYYIVVLHVVSPFITLCCCGLVTTIGHITEGDVT